MATYGWRRYLKNEYYVARWQHSRQDGGEGESAYYDIFAGGIRLYKDYEIDSNKRFTLSSPMDINPSKEDIEKAIRSGYRYFSRSPEPSPLIYQAISVYMKESRSARVPHIKYIILGPSIKYKKGSYVDQVTSESSSTYLKNGLGSGYWYEYIGLLNEAPQISGSDSFLGNKSSQSFTVDYVITDPDQGDSITVEIRQDDREPEVYKNITVGVRRYLTIDTSGYSLGDHKIVIKATDSQGASNIRTYTWTKVNNAPAISGEDKDLGAKNTGFTITYQVKDQDGDKVNVIEKLNGEVLRNLANAGQETDIQLTIPTDKIASLEINKLNTIEIEVSDSKGGVSYRRYTFTRDNFPPIISGTNTTISPGKDRVAYSYSVTDEEKDPIKVTTYLDSMVLERDKVVEDGKTYKIEISGQDFLKIRPGKHTLKIEATDGNSESVVRLVNFERSVTRFVIEKDTPFETDVAAKKIYLGLNGAVHVAEGAILKVEVCNNGFDLQPTWEDATSVSLANKSFNFQNTKKTAEKWGINIRVTVDRDQASRDSSATGLGGSFE